jgi:hypothetical protein
MALGAERDIEIFREIELVCKTERRKKVIYKNSGRRRERMVFITWQLALVVTLEPWLV